MNKFFMNFLLNLILNFNRIYDAVCNDDYEGPMSRNLKIRPIFANNMTIQDPREVNSLFFDVFSSAHLFAGMGETFTNVTSLTIGRFEGSLEFIDRDDFANMTQLIELDIFNNPIRNIDEDVFWDLPNLEVLRIFQAKLKNLPLNLLMNMKNLKEVSFHGNQLTHLDQDLFRNNPHLEIAVFEDNKLSSIKVDFTKFSNLQEVNFLGNVCTNLVFLEANPRLSKALSVSDLQAAINLTCN